MAHQYNAIENGVKPVQLIIGDVAHDEIMKIAKKSIEANMPIVELAGSIVPVIGDGAAGFPIGHLGHMEHLYQPMPIMHISTPESVYPNMSEIMDDDAGWGKNIINMTRQSGKTNIMSAVLRRWQEELIEREERTEEIKIGYILWEQPSVDDFIARHFPEQLEPVSVPDGTQFSGMVWREEDIMLDFKNLRGRPYGWEPSWVKNKLSHVIGEILNEQTSKEVPQNITQIC